MDDYKKILIMNPFGIGDVLFTSPVIQNLRLAYPQVFIGYLANRRNADFLKINPGINKVFVYERDEFVKVYRSNPLKFVHKWLELCQDISQEGFDLCLDYSLNSTLGFWVSRCGIKKRVGFDYRKRGMFLTDKLPFMGYDQKHIIEYDLDLLRYLHIPVRTNQMSLEVPQADQAWARQWIRDNNIDTARPLVAVLAGGGQSWGKHAPYRRWAVNKYADLLDKIIENYDAAVILLGDAKEEGLCRELVAQAHSPVYSLVAKTTLSQMAAIFKECRLAIVNDAGPLHVAVASGARTVSIFGPVDPGIYGPYPPDRHVVVQKSLPCQPCYRRFRMTDCSHVSCLVELSVDEVYRKVQSIL